MDLQELNKRYAILTAEERIEQVYADFEQILFTSSFGTSAAILLHMFSKVRPDQEVHFIDTTYHFSETIEYKDKLSDMLNLKIIDVLPSDWKNAFTRQDQTWTKDPDLCCSINKVEPLDQLKGNFEVWVSGLMRFQNSERKTRQIFEQKGKIIKFHPIIDFSEKDQNDYFKTHQLPRHPLEKHGFNSIGCAQCTFKGKGRAGRWGNSGKTECGLHL